MTAALRDILEDEAALALPSVRGTSQTGARLYNERLILSLIRHHGRLSKPEIARLTRLSAQTTTTITNRLEGEGLLQAGEPRRGRVGQPSVPYSLNPDGAFGLGLTVDRRSCELVAIDFNAGIRARRRMVYPFPVPGAVIEFVEREMPLLLGELPQEHRSRISGLGIAMPFELWNWEDDLRTPPGALAGWREADLGAEMARCFPAWPIRLCNDATSACAAELSFAAGRSYRDFGYFHVGAFVGGGVVLNGSLFPGRSGNAGALGSMPVLQRQPNGEAALTQLIRSASICRLESRLIEAGCASDLWLSSQDWSGLGAPLEAWLDEAAASLAQAVLAALSVIDFEAIVIDGVFPAGIRRRLVAGVRACLAALDRQGVTEAAIVEGSIGSDARAIGGAALPLLAAFARDHDVLFKD